MNVKWLWRILAVAVLGGLLLYFSRDKGELNVTPDAERAIEKARRR